jgi:hypothetical protein
MEYPEIMTQGEIVEKRYQAYKEGKVKIYELKEVIERYK